MTNCEARGCAGCPHCSPTLAGIMRATIRGDFKEAAALAAKVIDKLFPKQKYAAMRASAEPIPSPDPNAMAEALADPIAHRKRTIEYERDVIQTREIPRATPITGAPGSPDLLAEIRKSRQ